MSVNQTSVEQANVAGGSKAGMESVHTPWLKHLIKTFIMENLSNHSKGKDNTANQQKSHDGQQEQVLKPKGASKGKSRKASPLPFLQLDTSQTSWNDEVERAERDGDNMHSKRGGKRDRDPSESSDVRVSKRGAVRGAQGSQERERDHVEKVVD